MPERSPQAIQELLKQWARTGLEEDFERLYKSIYPRLLSYGIIVCGEPSLSQDTVQDVMMWVWSNRARLAEISAPESYLFSSVGNNLRTRMKRESRRQDLLKSVRTSVVAELPVEPTTDHESGEHQLLTDLKSLLSPRTLQVVYLRFFCDHSFKEIATITGTTPQVCQNYANRAIKKLRARGRRASFASRDMVVAAAKTVAVILLSVLLRP